MNPDDFPAPREGFVLAYFLVVSGRELRAYIRDPVGHLIEVGQTVGM